MNEHAVTPPFKAAKEPLSRLSGPYGHPLHPMFVTVPIGAWVSSIAFDLLGAAGKEPRAYAVGAKTLIDIGNGTALLAAVFGLLDFLKIPRGTRAWYVGVAHLTLNASAIALFAIGSASRRDSLRASEERNADAVTWQQRGISLATAGALGISGWLGGVLAYGYGVRVADEEHQREAGFRYETFTQRMRALLMRSN
ncbi:MAG: DUF2231 domain-containing protein [Candidatus Baltobacteraceae bacterium]